jgi:hypothetical protein
MYISSQDHDEIDPKCKGCERILKNLINKDICSCHRFPHSKWWFGEICPQATHIKHETPKTPAFFLSS